MTSAVVRAFVSGCAGSALTDDERAFLAEAQPWGLILFRRNVDNPEQVRRLTAEFREVTGRPDAPVLVDQEGGRVQRLRPPHWPVYPAAAAYAALADRDPAAALVAARLGGRLIAADLHAVGITIDCAPVLDLPVSGSSDVVGDRAFGRTADRVATLARAFADGLLDGGVLPVVKHMPGHGRAQVDSHHELPVVNVGLDVLKTADFAPFRRLSDLPAGMSAHVIYTAIDEERPATVSTAVVGDIIRGEIGFGGLLLTDDLSMQALSGEIGERAAAAFAAGCDIALHCNGVMEEARQVAAEAPILTGLAKARAEAALARLSPPQAFDREAGLADLARLIETAANVA